jgi:uncharacterized coiled-coil protein SlyX
MSKKSERLEFVKCLNGFITKQDAFGKSLEILKGFSEDTIKNLDMEIENKKLELEKLDAGYKQRDTDNRISVDQSLKEYKHEQAIKYLEERAEIAVLEVDYNKMTDKLDNIQEEYETKMEKAVSDEKERSQSAIKAIINNSNLAHKADIAEINAKSTQQENEITNLQNMITTLKQEISEQRELTKEVANAGKTGAINQSFGK